MTTPNRVDLDLNVVLFREEDMWVAQCLEYDVAAQGDRLREVISRWKLAAYTWVVEDSRKGNPTPFHGVSAAPSIYWKKWDKALALGERTSFESCQGDEFTSQFEIGTRFVTFKILD